VTADTIIVLRQLLRESKFDELTSRLQAYEHAARLDVRNEDALEAAYGSFHTTEPGLLPRFGAWVANDTGAPQPRIARAEHYFALAWRARGSDWARETPDTAFAEMQRWFDRQLPDILHAVRRDRTHLPALLILLDRSHAIGDPKGAEKVLRAILTISPASYVARRKYIQSLRPRWYGDLTPMRRLATDAQQALAQNPRLRVLLGFRYWDIGESRWAEDDTVGALGAYNAALRHGDSAPFLRGRAEVRYSQQQWELVIADLDCAIALAPGDAALLATRAMAKMRLAELDLSDTGRALGKQAVADLSLAKAVDSRDARVAWAWQFHSRVLAAAEK
jgi:hypothetical protein